MDEKRAREVLEERSVFTSLEDISQDGRTIFLDGNFTADELQALAWWMRNKGEKKE